jgi:hypothetical protein
MDTSNIIALALGGTGFIISIVGFVVTPILKLKSKRLEKRLEYRFELFQKILELWEFSHKNESSNKNEFEPLMKEVNKLIQLYGYNSEINSFKMAVNCYNNFAKEQNESNKQELKFDNFLSISFNAYRKEIVLDKLTD